MSSLDNMCVRSWNHGNFAWLDLEKNMDIFVFLGVDMSITTVEIHAE